KRRRRVVGTPVAADHTFHVVVAPDSVMAFRAGRNRLGSTSRTECIVRVREALGRPVDDVAIDAYQCDVKRVHYRPFLHLPRAALRASALRSSGDRAAMRATPPLGPPFLPPLRPSATA